MVPPSQIAPGFTPIDLLPLQPVWACPTPAVCSPLRGEERPFLCDEPCRMWGAVCPLPALGHHGSLFRWCCPVLLPLQRPVVMPLRQSSSQKLCMQVLAGLPSPRVRKPKQALWSASWLPPPHSQETSFCWMYLIRGVVYKIHYKNMSTNGIHWKTQQKKIGFYSKGISEFRWPTEDQRRTCLLLPIRSKIFPVWKELQYCLPLTLI